MLQGHGRVQGKYTKVPPPFGNRQHSRTAVRAAPDGREAAPDRQFGGSRGRHNELLRSGLQIDDEQRYALAWKFQSNPGSAVRDANPLRLAHRRHARGSFELMPLLRV